LENAIKDKQQFNELSIDDKKKILFELLDKNLLYVNWSQRDDKTFKITKEEKDISSFFNE
jgi:adenine-specific DNA-methyltransferase